MFQEKLQKFENTNTATKRKCIVKSGKSSHRGKIFGATLEARPCWLNFYHNILKMETHLSTIRMMLTSILVDLLWSLNVKKDVTVFAEGTYIYYFVLTEKGDWANLHESRQ